MTDSKYLTSIDELAAGLHNPSVVIIDTREPEEYEKGHIPGAVNIYDIFSYLALEENGGYPAMQRIFAQFFGQAGIDASKHVVVYEDAMDNGYGRSCRGRYILQYLGHTQASVLHGGYQSWLAKQLPVSKETSHNEPRQFIAKPDASIILTTEEMLSSLSDPSITILDCRDHAEWVGISSSPYGPDFVPRKGRIPGAIWLEWYQTMVYVNQIPWFKSPDDLRALFAAHGITPNCTIHLYCFKGARTSNMFIAMKMAGIENVRNYFGSWNEWARHPHLPIDSGYPKHK